MGWITPKTDWKSSDKFNPSIDYERIRGNITFLKNLALQMYAQYDSPNMIDVTINGFPTETFFNAIVDNIQLLQEKTFRPSTTIYMRHYVGNGLGWNAEELNSIEKNIQGIYSLLNSQYNALPKLKIMLGVNEL